MRIDPWDQRGNWDNWEKELPAPDKVTGWRLALGWAGIILGCLAVWAVFILAIIR